jgi:arginyl-tRNA synthetase
VQEQLKQHIREVLKKLEIQTRDFAVEHPADISHGDYSTNVAMVHAKELKSNLRELAEKIVTELSKLNLENIESTEIAGAGFINFKLKKEFFAESLKEISETKKWGSNDLSKGKKVMIEYTDPNPFKPFHIGHLMTNAIGESVARIFEYSGAHVVRANYQGDVGLHVAKSIWMLLQKGKGDTTLPAKDQAQYIGACYAEASTLYEENADAKAQIDAINKKVYDKSDPTINDMYDWGRKVTLDAFEDIYMLLDTEFDYYFFESEMAPIGTAIVKENIGKVFQESEGAIVFHAENYDPKLHTRVFITKQGLPTYETKEVGLVTTKFTKENPDLSITVTAIEQGEYMKVVEKAISLMHPDLASRMSHLTHGMMRFASGKMSSRKGNVITGESLLSDANELVYAKMAERELSAEERKQIAEQVSVGAIKYVILKQALGGNIIYDEEKSVSFEGDSGPYLQYTAVRAAAVLFKGHQEGILQIVPEVLLPKEWTTTTLEKYLYRFPEIVLRAYELREPHHIATYLTELASLFNSFYAEHQIVNTEDASSAYKLAITQAFYTTIQNGLYLLGISVPEKM